MTTSHGAPPTGASDREIVITRPIDAPRELVFEAFTEVRHLSRWWGPRGFTTTTRTFAFREGWCLGLRDARTGRLRLPQLDHLARDRAARTDRPNPRRVAEDPNAFDSIITFADHGATTEMVMRTVFPTAELRDQAVEEYHAVEGGRQTLDRLAACVTEQAMEPR